MSKSDLYETDILALLFNGTPIPNIADNAGASPLTDLWVALHTTPGPGESGLQDVNEANYSGYNRIAVARNGGGWVVGGDTVNPAVAIDFDPATGGTNTITHFSIGVASGGSTKVLYFGVVTPNIAVSNGVTPSLTASSNVTED